MLIKMKKHDFDLLTEANLGQGCFQPLIQMYKCKVAEQSADDQSQIKESFYKQLNEGQRALFMFFAYYNHARKSMAEFYWWSAFFFAQPKSWAAIKSGLKYFEDESLLRVLEMVEIELNRHHYPDKLEQFKVTREELERNQELQTSIKSLYDLFTTTSSLSISKINKYIEQNLQEFVEIEG